jgi:Arc-like DNA binding domain
MAKLNLRFPEVLRRVLTREAKKHRRSLNSEIVERLYRSLQGTSNDQSELIAQALLRDLDHGVLAKMYEAMKESDEEDRLADFQREFELEERGK